MILALETATNVCSVAFKDAGGEVYEKRTDRRGSHSEKLFLFIEELMKEPGFTLGQLQAVLVSEGPGSYTGLRIAASAVKGLLFQSTTPLFGINTLASFARAVTDVHPAAKSIHSIIDARRVHVYHQQFLHENDTLSAPGAVEVTPIEEFEAMVREGEVITGTGLARIDEEVRKKALICDRDLISARSLIRLFEEGAGGMFVRKVPPEEFVPRYYTSRQVGR